MDDLPRQRLTPVGSPRATRKIAVSVAKNLEGIAAVLHCAGPFPATRSGAPKGRIGALTEARATQRSLSCYGRRRQ